MHWVQERLGSERMKNGYLWRTYRKNGLLLTGGSDAPVESCAPMPAIYSAVTRTDLEGWPKGGMQPEEKLSVYEALCLFSKNIPYAVGGEVCTGTLEVGKFADMAVLDRDILQFPRRRFCRCRCCAPCLPGKIHGNATQHFQRKKYKGYNMKSKNTMGHLAALFTVAVWGTTLISTKVLLNAFQPVEILFFRFSLGFLALLAVCPHRLKGTSLKQECTLAAAGLCGICLYYLLENMALSYSLASNVGVILSAAPFFTAILSHLVMKEQEKLPGTFLRDSLLPWWGSA